MIIKTISTEDFLLTDEFINNKKTLLNKNIKGIINGKEMITFFSDYIAWNGIFGGAVSSLSGKWHNAMYSGTLNEQIISAMQKYSHKVASQIFAAAEEEYNHEPNLNIRVTHKDMAWHFFTSLMNFYSIDKRPKLSDTVSGSIYNTLLGYGVKYYNNVSLKILIQNLGFHIASEKIASFEFDFLYNELKESKPDLFNWLDGEILYSSIGKSTNITALEWLKCHGTVEEDHFQHALNAAEIARTMVLENGLMSDEQFLSNISHGFNMFSDLQDSFFNKY